MSTVCHTGAMAVYELSLQLEGRLILDHISFAVAPGSYCAIAGPNGAGKSTLLKCLNRLHNGWTGGVTLEGQDLSHYTQAELARRLGYVPQYRSAPEYEVSEFLLMSRYARHTFWGGVSWDDCAAVGRAGERVGITYLFGRSMTTLSGGEGQKVMIAAALVQETDIILLDEPTTFLDPRFQHEINNLLVELNRQDGKTLIVVSHDLNIAALSADRMLLLKEGRLIADAPPADIMRPEYLDPLFETTFTFLTRADGKKIIVPALSAG